MPDPIKPTAADYDMADAISVFCGPGMDFDAVARLLVIHAQQAREQALEEAAADKARLDFITDETLDLRCFDVPTGGDDYSVAWQVIQHHMAPPRKRVIGEAEEYEGPRIAIDRAILALKEQPR